MRPVEYTRWFRCVWLLIFLLGTGCGLVRRPPPVVDRSQDPRILREVEARFSAEPLLDVAQIRIEVDGGIVVLYGNVQGIVGWRCAIRNAQLVDGVRSVVDFLLIERANEGDACRAPVRWRHDTTTDHTPAVGGSNHEVADPRRLTGIIGGRSRRSSGTFASGQRLAYNVPRSTFDPDPLEKPEEEHR